MSSGVHVRLQLTRTQADAILRSKGLSQGHGIRRSLTLQEADMRLRHAVINALHDRDEYPAHTVAAAEPGGESSWYEYALIEKDRSDDQLVFIRQFGPTARPAVIDARLDRGILLRRVVLAWEEVVDPLSVHIFDDDASVGPVTPEDPKDGNDAQK